MGLSTYSFLGVQITITSNETHILGSEISSTRELNIPLASTYNPRQFRDFLHDLRSSLGRLPLDPSKLTGFQHAVFGNLNKVPFGKIVTYLDLAKQVGSPKGSRAVGNCMATNPFPLIIPCHRVLPTSGKIGNYTCKDSNGSEIKKRLLQLEGFTFKS